MRLNILTNTAYTTRHSKKALVAQYRCLSDISLFGEIGTPRSEAPTTSLAG